MIRKNNLFRQLIILILQFIMILSTHLFGIIKSISDLGIYTIICFLLTMIALQINDKKMSFFKIFIVFTYLFAFGQCMLNVIGYKTKLEAFSITNNYFTFQEIYKAAHFILIGICLMSFGYCLLTKVKNKKYLPYKVNLRNQNSMIIIGWILVVFCLIPTFYLLSLDIKSIFSTGYASVHTNGNVIIQISIILSGFFSSGLLILFCFEEKRRKILYIILIIYFSLQLMGGSRIEVFRFLIVLFLIYSIYMKKVDKKTILIIFILGIGFIYIFSFVSSVRNYIFITSDLNKMFSDTFTNLYKNNFIFSAINEMGITQIINTLVFSNCPNNIDYAYGFSYLKSLYGIFPNIMNLSYISMDTVFAPLYTITSSGLGGSYIMELYWNFGYLSFFLFPLLGAGLKKLDLIFYNISNSESGKSSTLFIVVYLIFILIFWVRTDSIEFCRSFVYYCLIPVVLSKIKF